MPLQNRVDPFGALHAVSQRGIFMGNRGGRIHDPATKTLQKRCYASRRWIICNCVYKDWQREVMGPGYTELFFLDEVTALAAGYRPCAFCRRDAFKRYRQCSTTRESSVDEMDRQLHTQRLGPKHHYFDILTQGAPNGLMVAIGDACYAKHADLALQWSFDGYVHAANWLDIAAQNPLMLTPQNNIIALQNGYMPVWHPSATL